MSIVEFTIEDLAKFVEDQEIYLAAPGSYKWQGDGCYTAYKNYTNPNACELAEDKNPVRALRLLRDKLMQPKEAA